MIKIFFIMRLKYMYVVKILNRNVPFKTNCLREFDQRWSSKSHVAVHVQFYNKVPNAIFFCFLGSRIITGRFHLKIKGDEGMLSPKWNPPPKSTLVIAFDFRMFKFELLIAMSRSDGEDLPSFLYRWILKKLFWGLVEVKSRFMSRNISRECL